MPAPRTRGMTPTEKREWNVAKAKADKIEAEKRAARARYNQIVKDRLAWKRKRALTLKKAKADKALISGWKASAAATAALSADASRRASEHKKLMAARNAEARKLAQAREKERQARAAQRRAAIRSALSTKKTTTTRSDSRVTTTGGKSTTTGMKQTAGGS